MLLRSGYSEPTDIFAPQYASITPATTPSDLAIVFAMGFAGSDYLILNSYRLSFLQDEQANPDGGFPTTTTGLPAALPKNTLRQDLKTNDLRNWTPTMPTANDPYANEKDAFNAAVTATEVAAIAGGATDGGHAAVLED